MIVQWLSSNLEVFTRTIEWGTDIIYEANFRVTNFNFINYLSFVCDGDRSPFFTMGSAENVLNVAHVLRFVIVFLYYLISLLTVAVCYKRVIPLDTIIASAIFCPLAHTNYLPFSNCLIRQDRGSAGS